MPSGFRIILITCMLLLGTLSLLAAQENSESLPYRYDFRGESMINVLDRIARETDIDLVYDPKLIRNVTVYKRVNQPDVPGLLSALLTDYRLDYITLSSGTIVIVRTPRENPSFGNLSGLVVDGKTGEPLPGATVLLADASGGTSTNHNGHFSMNRLISGTHHIIISYMGYESAYKTIQVQPGRSMQEKIDLTPKPVHIEPLVVQAHRSRLPSSNSGNSVNPQNSDVSPGLIQSPIRSLNLMSGVQYGLPMKDMNLQGSDQGEHRILLDGVPVYNPYSFGKLFSSFSPYAIGNITLHKAGYGSDRGSLTAGVIELNHDLRPDDTNRLLLQTDPSSINFRGDISIPVSGRSPIKMMGAVRSSYWNVFRNPALERTLNSWDKLDPLLANAILNPEVDTGLYAPVDHQSDVAFHDIHLAGVYRPDDYSRLELSVYSADNRIETGLINEQLTNLNEPRYLYAIDAHEWSNRLFQANWTKLISPRLDLSIRTGYSENTFNHVNRAGFANNRPSDLNVFRTLSSASYDLSPEVSQPLPTRIDGNLIRHFQISADAAYSINPSVTVESGLKSEHVYSDVTLTEPSSLLANTERYSTMVSNYLRANHHPGMNWRITYGSRFTWLNTTNNVYPEPRASIQYDKPESALGYWSVRVAGGLFRQFINEYRITNTGPTAIVPDIPIWSHTGNTAIPKAWHLTASLLMEPTDHSSFTAELFHKWHPVTNFTTYVRTDDSGNPSATDVSAYGITTDMRSFGGGVRYTHDFLNNALQMTAGYDYSFAEIHLDDQFGKPVTTPWNEPHRAQFNSLFRLRPNVTIVAKWQGIWGRSWAYRRAYYNFLQFNENGTSLSELFNSPDQDRLPAFHQVDLSVIWQPSVRFAEFELRADLINLLNRKNSLEKYLVPEYENGELTGYSERYRTMPGLYPNFSVRISI